MGAAARFSAPPPLFSHVPLYLVSVRFLSRERGFPFEWRLWDSFSKHLAFDVCTHVPFMFLSCSLAHVVLMYVLKCKWLLQKQQTTLGPKLYCQLAPFTKPTCWGCTAKSSRLLGSKFQGLQFESRPRAVGATYENRNAWICILCISEKQTLLQWKTILLQKSADLPSSACWSSPRFSYAHISYALMPICSYAHMPICSCAHMAICTYEIWGGSRGGRVPTTFSTLNPGRMLYFTLLTLLTLLTYIDF